jgi:HlyD family secretion protein
MFNTLKEKIKGFWNTYKKSKLAWFILLVVGIIIVVIITKGQKTTENASLATVAKKDLVESVQLSGRTQSASAVELGFADQGRIASVYVNEGDKVRAGQVLARLDTSDLDASLKNAQAALVIARAGVTTNTNNVEKVTREQDALVDNARRALLSNDLEAVPKSGTLSATAPTITGSYNGPEGEYVVRVSGSSGTSAQSFSVTGIESDVSNTAVPNQSVTLGTKGLYIQFLESGQYAYTEWVVAVPNKRSATYSTYYNAYLAAKNSRDIAIANAQATIGSGMNDQSVSRARVEQAQASVDSIISQINKRKIIAPFDGVIANVSLKPGQSTTGTLSTTGTEASKNTVTLISENDYEVVLKAPEISVAKLAVGQAVDLRLDAYGKDVVFPGKITSINPAETILDGVPVYETKVIFTEKDDRIRSGMTANAMIITNTKSQALSLSADMIKTDKEGSYVFVMLDEKKTEKRAVTTGLRSSDSFVEIVSGLNEGDRVSNVSL